jgi:hypothetical protein
MTICTECKKEASKLTSVRIVDSGQIEHAKRLCIDCAAANLKLAEKNCSLFKKCKDTQTKAKDNCNFARRVIPNLKDIKKEARRRGDRARQKMAHTDIIKAKKECIDANKAKKISCGKAVKRACNTYKTRAKIAMNRVDGLNLKKQILSMPKAPTHQHSPRRSFGFRPIADPGGYPPKRPNTVVYSSNSKQFAPPVDAAGAPAPLHRPHRAKKAAHRPPLEIPAQELLGRSSFNGDLTGVERAWEAGADVNAAVFWIGRQNRGPGPRTCGVGGTFTAAFVAATQGHPNVLRFLLDKGANPNRGDTSDGMSPCLAACTWRQVECVRVLLEEGANPNLALTDGSNFTPCMETASVGAAVCLRALAPAGMLTSVNEVATGGYYEGKTALGIAIDEENVEIANYLQELGGLRANDLQAGGAGGPGDPGAAHGELGGAGPYAEGDEVEED